MSADARRDFVLRCVDCLCGPSASKQAAKAAQLDHFLNDNACRVLQVCVPGSSDLRSPQPDGTDDEAKDNAAGIGVPCDDAQITISNSLQSMDWESCSGEVHFLKTNTDVLTEENIAKCVIVTSMLQSPLTSLYHSLHSVYAPTLLNDAKWATRLDHKTQGLLTDLESGLGVAVRGIGGEAYGSSSSNNSNDAEQQPRRQQVRVEHIYICWQLYETLAFIICLDLNLANIPSLDQHHLINQLIAKPNHPTVLGHTYSYGRVVVLGRSSREWRQRARTCSKVSRVL
jgi:hypothetical protein